MGCVTRGGGRQQVKIIKMPARAVAVVAVVGIVEIEEIVMPRKKISSRW
jgi:hypothetical protein